jgi:hypothetical protein
MAPQLILIVLWSMSVGMTAMKHGDPKQGKYNFWTVIASVAFEAALLWWGGFFAPFAR